MPDGRVVRARHHLSDDGKRRDRCDGYRRVGGTPPQVPRGTADPGTGA